MGDFLFFINQHLGWGGAQLGSRHRAMGENRGRRWRHAIRLNWSFFLRPVQSDGVDTDTQTFPGQCLTDQMAEAQGAIPSASGGKDQGRLTEELTSQGLLCCGSSSEITASQGWLFLLVTAAVHLNCHPSLNYLITLNFKGRRLFLFCSQWASTAQ